MVKDFKLHHIMGTEEQWNHLLKDLSHCNRSLDSVFKKFEIDDNIIDDIPFVVSGLEYKNWLVFLYLKVNVTTLQNDYLRAVVEITDTPTPSRRLLISFFASSKFILSQYLKGSLQKYIFYHKHSYAHQER